MNLMGKMAEGATIAAGLSATIVAVVFLARGSFWPVSGASPFVAWEEVPGWAEYADVGHRSGSTSPTVTIVEFGDYQCPYCAAAVAHLDHVLDQFSEVALVYRHMPLEGHPHARPASRAAECAATQGAFERFHRLLYTDRSWMAYGAVEDFLELAERGGVADAGAFERCIVEGGEVDQAIVRDLEAARRLGIRGTPSFLINDRLYRGLLDSLQLKEVIVPMLEATTATGRAR
jgi:protein-disulfide isomerase